MEAVNARKERAVMGRNGIGRNRVVDNSQMEWTSSESSGQQEQQLSTRITAIAIKGNESNSHQ